MKAQMVGVNIANVATSHSCRQRDREVYNSTTVGYEEMERRVPCPCGKGTQVAGWQQHDYRLDCEACAAQYAYYWHTGREQVWILKEDSLKLSALELEAKADREKLHELIVERYEAQFVSHVLENSKDNPSSLGEVARRSIRDRPRESFARLHVEDSEVNGLTTKIDALNKEIFEFKMELKMILIPDRQ